MTIQRRLSGLNPDCSDCSVEYTIAMNPPAPFHLGRMRYVPTGEPYSVPAIDVIRFQEGLVSEKVTFLDTDTIRANSRGAAPVGASR